MNYVYYTSMFEADIITLRLSPGYPLKGSVVSSPSISVNAKWRLVDLARQLGDEIDPHRACDCLAMGGNYHPCSIWKHILLLSVYKSCKREIDLYNRGPPGMESHLISFKQVQIIPYKDDAVVF